MPPRLPQRTRCGSVLAPHACWEGCSVFLGQAGRVAITCARAEVACSRSQVLYERVAGAAGNKRAAKQQAAQPAAAGAAAAKASQRRPRAPPVAARGKGTKENQQATQPTTRGRGRPKKILQVGRASITEKASAAVPGYLQVLDEPASKSGQTLKQPLFVTDRQA